MIGPLRVARGGGKPRATRVGVAVQGNKIRIVGVDVRARRSTRVCWAVEGELESGESIAKALRELLAGAPLRRWRRTAVVVALGSHASQVRPLYGLPPADAAVLARIVAASAQRFFLRQAMPLVVGGVRIDDDGQVWGIAIAAPLLGELTAAVRAANARLVAITALPVALAGALQRADGIADCEDQIGPVTCRYRAGCFAGLLDGTPGVEQSVPWLPALTQFGDSAPKFAVAYGAAVLEPHEALALLPAEQRYATARRRLTIAATVATGCTMIALATPLWRATQFQQRAQAEILTRGPHYAAAFRDEARLAATDAALREVAGWDARRVSQLALLDMLAGALPEEAALVSLRADTTHVSLVVVAPHITVVTAALDRASRARSGLADLSLVGAVTRETFGGRELERATLKLRVTGARP